MRDLEHRILVLGATGYTGRLIVKRLIERGVDFTATARSEPELRHFLQSVGGADVPTRSADLQNAADILWIAHPKHLILNCVGPFSIYSRQLIAAVAAAGAWYVDICGEEPFVGHTLLDLDAIARRSGALILHSCAFESLPAQVLAWQVCKKELTYRNIFTYYRTGRNGLSPGTRLTMRLAAQSRSCIYQNGAFVECRPGDLKRPLALPFIPEAAIAVLSPLPEIRFLPLMFSTHAAATFLALTALEAALVGPVAVSRTRTIEETLQRHQNTLHHGPSPHDRQSQRFTIGVAATESSGVTRFAYLKGVDPYGLTAAIAVWVCEQLRGILLDGQRPTGVRPPLEVLDPGSFVESALAWPFGLQFG